MLATFEVQLQPEGVEDELSESGEKAYALILRLCHRVNPPFAQRLHDAGGAKPLGVWYRRQDDTSSADNGIHLRVGTLTAQATQVVAAALNEAASSRHRHHLAGRPLRVEGFETTIQTTYADLLACRPRRSIALRFLSPTAFRRSGVNLIFPAPELLFGSLLRRWNTFSPTALPARLQDEFESILVSRYHLHTTLVSFSDYKLVGFLGDVTYELPRKWPQGLKQMCTALAAFVDFAGVGYKTTMGMGCCHTL